MAQNTCGLANLLLADCGSLSNLWYPVLSKDRFLRIIHYWSAHTSFDFCNLSWWQNSAAETTIFTKILHYTLSKLSLQYVTTIWCNNFSSQRVVCCHNRMLSVFWSLRFVFCITLCNGWTMNLIVHRVLNSPLKIMKRELGELYFSKDFWDCYEWQGKKIGQ